MATTVAGTIVSLQVTELFDSDGDEDNDFLTDAYLLNAMSRKDHVKTQDFTEYTVPNLLPCTFKRFFRMSRSTVEVICRALSDCIELTPRALPGGRPEIPLDKKILITLRYLASQETLLELSNRFNVTEFTALKARRDVIQAIHRVLLHKFIHWPDRAEYNRIAQDFDNIGQHNLPNVIGAIDGSHIPIQAPNKNPLAYFNRKKFHSVILQAVATSDTKFTSINVGWPGRVHDAKVLKKSGLWETGYEKTMQGRYHLLGDAAYPIKEWLLTPYRDNGHLTHRQGRFNKCLSSKRQVIERAFGLLKTRFRRLKNVHILNMDELCNVVSACCVFHNICLSEGDELEEAIDNDVQQHPAPVPQLLENDAQGRLKRVLLTNAL